MKSTTVYRVLVCDNMAFHGDFTPVLAKHSKHFSLIDAVSIGADRMQRNFEPLARHIELLRQAPLTDEAAKLIIYRAFVEGELEAPRHLARTVHERYFRPQHDEFARHTMWSLSNAFTSAFKELDAIPQFRATAKLGHSCPSTTAGTRHKCASCPAGDPDSYFVFPRSEINSLGKDWLDDIRRVVVNGGDIELAKHELDRRNGVETIYLLRLEPAAQVMSLRYSSEYDLEHRELERAREISHSLADCPERLHPAPVRIWTPAAGWKELAVKPAGFAQ